MNKKGQGLPFNAVVLGLIAVVVVLFVVLIFFGGATWIKDTLAGIGGERLKGVDITLAQQNCELYCDQAKGLSLEAAKQSSYCIVTYRLDKDSDGEADFKTVTKDGKEVKEHTKYSCKDVGITCGVTC